MRMRKEPDLRVGQGKPAHQIILQISLDRKSEGFFRQTAPSAADRPPAGRAAAGQRRRVRRGARRQSDDRRPPLPRAARGRPPAAVRARAVAARPPDRRGRGLRPRHQDRHLRARGGRRRASTRPTSRRSAPSSRAGCSSRRRSPQQQAALQRLETSSRWSRAGSTRSSARRPPSGCRPPPSSRRPYAAAAPPAVRPRRPSPRWSASSCGRAGCATPRRCGARCARARAPRPATRVWMRTPTCCPPPPTSTTRWASARAPRPPRQLTDDDFDAALARAARRGRAAPRRTRTVSPGEPAVSPGSPGPLSGAVGLAHDRDHGGDAWWWVLPPPGQVHRHRRCVADAPVDDTRARVLLRRRGRRDAERLTGRHPGQQVLHRVHLAAARPGPRPRATGPSPSSRSAGRGERAAHEVAQHHAAPAGERVVAGQHRVPVLVAHELGREAGVDDPPAQHRHVGEALGEPGGRAVRVDEDELPTGVRRGPARCTGTVCSPRADHA